MSDSDLVKAYHSALGKIGAERFAAGLGARWSELAKLAAKQVGASLDEIDEACVRVTGMKIKRA